MTVLNSSSKSPTRGRWLFLAFAMFTAIAVVISLLTGEAARRALFDRWQAISPRDLTETKVDVVLIDSDSIAAVGAWPWPRYYMARLTEQIAARGASVIAFDILFSEPDRVRPDLFADLYPELSPTAAAEVAALEPMDRQFGRVIGMAPVVLARAGADADSGGTATLPIDVMISGALPPAIENWPVGISAIPELDDVALGHGLVNASPDRDGVIRSVPLVMRVGGKVMPGLAMEVARTRLQVSEIKSQRDSLRFAGRRIPVDEEARMLLHFGTFPPANIKSASEVLKNDFSDQAFAGKIVLVGLAAEGTSDIVATPSAAEEYGVLVQAQAIDTLLRGGWLERPRWATMVEWGTGFTLALAALGAALANRLARIGLGVAFLGIAVGAWLAFDGMSLLIDPLRPILLGGGSVAGLVFGSFVDTRTERMALRDQLMRERITAAQAEGELLTARAIQLGMVPSRPTLATIEPRIDCDALLEPARSVGGDFYDLLRIDADRIGFVMADVTGKGVPAALFMAMAKALTQSTLSRDSNDLAAAAATINRELISGNDEAMSVTMLMGVLDVRDGTIRLISAGHEHPLRVSANLDVALCPLDGGPPFGITEFDYPVETLALGIGDALVLLTDGITEAQDGRSALYGHDRVVRSEALTQSTATQICEAIRDDVRRFEDGTEATDDLTVMVIRYLGNAAEQPMA